MLLHLLLWTLYLDQGIIEFQCRAMYVFVLADESWSQAASRGLSDVVLYNTDILIYYVLKYGLSEELEIWHSAPFHRSLGSPLICTTFYIFFRIFI